MDQRTFSKKKKKKTLVPEGGQKQKGVGGKCAGAKCCCSWDFRESAGTQGNPHEEEHKKGGQKCQCMLYRETQTLKKRDCSRVYAGSRVGGSGVKRRNGVSPRQGLRLGND